MTVDNDENKQAFIDKNNCKLEKRKKIQDESE